MRSPGVVFSLSAKYLGNFFLLILFWFEEVKGVKSFKWEAGRESNELEFSQEMSWYNNTKRNLEQCLQLFFELGLFNTQNFLSPSPGPSLNFRWCYAGDKEIFQKEILRIQRSDSENLLRLLRTNIMKMLRRDLRKHSYDHTSLQLEM